MTKTQVLQALDLHNKQMEERFTLVGGGAMSALRNQNAVNGSEQIRHLKWMANEIIHFLAEDRTEKAMRWLGFIQGALWVMGLSSIEESKRANMPEGEEYKP